MIKKLEEQGGQNPIDAAYSNCKIYHGPYVSNFTEVYKILRDNNISKEINNYEELSKNLASDLKNPHKKENSYSNITNFNFKPLNLTTGGINGTTNVFRISS